MSTITARFIGSGDAFGSGGRLQTCILVDAPGMRFAIDFGTTSLVGLRQQGVDLLIAECYFYIKSVKWHMNYPDIAHLAAKRIVLTHMHADMLAHVDDVPELCAHDGLVVTL